MDKITRCFIFLLFTLIFSGCSCEKQMYRLSYKCPDLFTTKDIPYTYTIPEYHVDTVFVFSKGDTDTLTITDNRGDVVIIRQLDTLKVFIHLPADTITEYIPVEVPKPIIESKKTFWDHLETILILIIIGGVIYGIILIIKYKTNKNGKTD